MLAVTNREMQMSTTTLMNYSTRDFANNDDLQLYLERQDAAFSPAVTKLFTDAGMLRRVVTRI
jgi:isopentenyl diphosphate isomerase/L-lactate dehydrogenase-like FMN-dependent dehydrogenase